MKTKHIIIIGFIFFMVAAIFSNGYLHPDEHFQVLEFANYKMGNTPANQLTWEFKEQMRPTFQVGIAYILCTTLKALHMFDPFIAIMILRMITGLAMFYILYLFYDRYKNELQSKQGPWWLASLIFLTWFIPFLSVRYSSESFGTIFILAAILQLQQLHNKPLKLMGYMLVGLLLGISFISRFQMGFMIIGLGLWLIMIKKEKFKSIVSILLGFLLAFAIGLLCDHWFYGEWVSSPYNYFYQNLVVNKAAEFGTSPIWYYAAQTPIFVFPIFGIIIVPCLLYFFYKYPRHLFTWLLIPFIVVHHAIGHKELRFLIPMIPFTIFIVVVTLEKISWIKKINWLKYPFWTLNLLALFLRTLVPADDQNAVYKEIYTKYSQNMILYDYNDRHRLLLNPTPNKTHQDLQMQFYLHSSQEFTPYHTYEDLDSLIAHQPSLEIIICSKAHEDFIKTELSKNKHQVEVVFETYHKNLDIFNFGNRLYSENLGWWVLLKVENK